MPRARGAGPAWAGPTPGTRQYAAHVAAGATSGKKRGGELIYRGIPHVTALETGLAHQSSTTPPTTTDHSGFTTARKKGNTLHRRANRQDSRTALGRRESFYSYHIYISSIIVHYAFAWVNSDDYSVRPHGEFYFKITS
jgi:hypothetical protein